MKEKNVGIELLRILATNMVIVLHIVGGCILSNLQKGTIKYEVFWLIEISAYCAVNCFGIISGYVMVGRKIRYRRIISLWIMASFYSSIFTLITYCIYPNNIGIKGVLISFFPVLSNSQWYFVSYFGLFFLIPFLNVTIDKITKRQYILLLGICMFIFSFLPIMENTGLFRRYVENDIDLFSIGNGYNPLWLVICYLFGAYIKKHGKMKKKNGMRLYLVCVCTTYIVKNLAEIVQFVPENILISYISPTILFAAYGLVVNFSNIAQPNMKIRKNIMLIS